jgi:endonuclease G
MYFRNMFIHRLITVTIMLLHIGTATNAQQQFGITRDGRIVILFDNYTWQYQDSSTRNSHILTHTLPVKIDRSCDVVSHTGFALCYSEKHEQAEWVSYMLCRARLVRAAERSDRFVPDPKVKTRSADNNDYKASGYDRGHLAPAADMAYSEITMRESFYYSNVSPQIPSFNRGIWKRLEEQVRSWADIHDTIWIATGPVLKSSLPAIGPNQVSVPELYYKAILVSNSNTTQAIAIVMPNQNSPRSIESYVITIDSLQRLTGIDFFSELPDELERTAEQKVDMKFWFGNIQLRAAPASSTRPAAATGVDGTRSAPKSPATASQQCRGMAKSTGTRCKNKTTNANGYCHVHQSQAK